MVHAVTLCAVIYFSYVQPDTLFVWTTTCTGQSRRRGVSGGCTSNGLCSDAVCCDLFFIRTTKHTFIYVRLGPCSDAVCCDLFFIRTTKHTFCMDDYVYGAVPSCSKVVQVVHAVTLCALIYFSYVQPNTLFCMYDYVYGAVPSSGCKRGLHR